MKLLVIGGTSSGVGKTSLALGIMVALRRLGLRVQPFKVGPAFTDPMQHRLATGNSSINLDSWLMGKEALLQSFRELSSGCDIALVEGAMGLFDGTDNRTEHGSTAQIAKWIGAPVLLVLDAWAVGRSAAAIIKGYQQFDQSLELSGVLFNRITDSEQLQSLKDALDGADVGLPVVGGVPKDDLLPQDASLHDASCAVSAMLEHLANLVEHHVDLQQLLAGAKELQQEQQQEEQQQLPAALPSRPRTRIAVAQDAAFCFYYHENLLMLQQQGAELVHFSPLQDQQLPANVAGIYLGGGCPERYAQQLASNAAMLAAVRAFAAAGGVIYAECAGLVYLSQAVEQQHCSNDPMVGVFSFKARMTNGQQRSGYLEVSVLPGCPLFPAGSHARGHMSHCCEVVQEVRRGLGAAEGADGSSSSSSSSSHTHSYSARLVHSSSKVKQQGEQAVEEGYTVHRVLASLVHLHFRSCPQLAAALVDACCEVDAPAACQAAAEAAAAAQVQHKPRSSITGARSLPELHLALSGSHSKPPRVLSQGALSPQDLTPCQPEPSRLHRGSSMESSTDGTPRGPFTSSSCSHMAAADRGLPPVRLPDWASGIPSSLEAVASRVSNLLQQPQKRMPHERTAAPASLPYGYSSTEQLLDSHLPVSGRTHAKLIGLAVPISKASSTFSPAASSLYLQQQQQLSKAALYPPPSISHQDEATAAEKKLSNSSRRSSFSTLGSESDLRPLGRPSAQFARKTFDLHEPYGEHTSKASITPDHHHDSHHSKQAAVQEAPSPRSARSSMQQDSPRRHHHKQQQQQQQPPAAFHLPSALATASAAAAALHPTHHHHTHHIANDSIVSLCPAATDTVLAMGLASRLAAATGLCDLPPDLQHIPLVCTLKFDPRRCTAAEAQQLSSSKGALYHIDEAWLREEQPGVVLVPASSAPYDIDGASVLQVLERAALLRHNSTTTIVCHECYALADVLQFALLVGAAAGVPEAAGLVVDRLRTRLRRLRMLTAQAQRQPKLLVLESIHPLVAAGHWAGEVQHMAGGLPCFPQQAQDAPRALSWEEVRQFAPEVLVLSQHLQRADKAVAEVSELAAQPGWWSLPAVRSGQVYVVDSACVSRPGPRLVDGAELLGSLLHPALVPRRGGAHGLVLKLSLSGGQRCRHCLVHNYFVAW